MSRPPGSGWGCFVFDPCRHRGARPAKVPRREPAPREPADLRAELAKLDGKSDHFSRRERERLTRELARRGAL